MTETAEPPDEQSRKRKAIRRRWALLGLLVLIAAALIVVFRPDPQAELMASLRIQGFEPNVGFAAHYQPGTVIQLRKRDAGGEVRTLPRPEIVLWPDQCFPGIEPRPAPYPLPSRRGRRQTTIRLEAAQALRFLPALGIAGAKQWEIEIASPQLLTFARLELDEKFSEFCLDGLERTFDADDDPSWFRTISEAVVADGMTITIDWQADADADVKAAAERAVEESLEPAEATVEVRLQSEERTVLAVDGRIVLAYRTFTMEPESYDE